MGHSASLWASSVGCSSAVTLSHVLCAISPSPRAVCRSWNVRVEIYERRSPAMPRSGLARRFIDGLSSSTLGLQALSIPWFTAGCGEAHHTSRIFLVIWWLDCGRGPPGIGTHSPPLPGLGCLSAHWPVFLGGKQGVCSLICSRDGDHCLRPWGEAEHTSPGLETMGSEPCCRLDA